MNLFTLSDVVMWVRLRYVSVILQWVWSPWGQMAWVWGDTKRFH